MNECGPLIRSQLWTVNFAERRHVIGQRDSGPDLQLIEWKLVGGETWAFFQSHVTTETCDWSTEIG